jgi:outer membrane protein OmpA-like peptidoglycan-associated protein
MKRKVKQFAAVVFSLPLLAGCTYNPFIADNNTTGSPVGAAIGAGVGAGSVALLGGSKPYIGLAGLAGGAIGYYVTTLRYESGGILQAGGKVYKIGDNLGIYIPTDQVFEPNTDEFLPQARPILDSVVVVLKRYPSNNIMISGNTSGFYRARWEQKLSERRAQKVSAYLWNAGINDFKPASINMRKLNYVGHGDYFPIANKITNTGIRENSRIQITSYPSDRSLLIDQKHQAVYNIGDLNSDVRISRAPQGGCETMDSTGNCLDTQL